MEPGLWLHHLFSLPCSQLAHGCPGGSGWSLLTIEQGGGLLDGFWDLLQAILSCPLQVRGRGGGGTFTCGIEYTLSRCQSMGLKEKLGWSGGKGRHRRPQEGLERPPLIGHQKEGRAPSLPLRLEHSSGALTSHSALVASRVWVTLALPASLLCALGQPSFSPFQFLVYKMRGVM